MNSLNKPKTSIKKQINILKDKGILFDKYSEDQAFVFLQNNSYLFKVKAYCNTYKQKDKGGNKLKYQNLDFAYLVDLSTIDMHFRRFIIRFMLDLEHALKTKIIRDFNICKDDGYACVSEFLAQNSHTMDFLDKEISKINSLKFKNKDLNSITQYILSNYEKDLAIWNFIEVIQFGNFLEFCKFFYNKYHNIEFNSIQNELFNIKFLRNAAAHNNCMLANLKDNIQEPQKRIIDEIYRLKIFKNKTRNFIKNSMKNRVINDFIAALVVYNQICKSQKMKFYCFSELYQLFCDRAVRNHNYYKTEKIIKARYLFCAKIVKYFKILNTIS